MQDFADEPDSLGEDDSIAALLDAAEDIVNAAGPDILRELEADKKGPKETADKQKRAQKERSERSADNQPP